jgi:hypothetical protein
LEAARRRKGSRGWITGAGRPAAPMAALEATETRGVWKQTCRCRLFRGDGGGKWIMEEEKIVFLFLFSFEMKAEKILPE